MRDDKVQSNLKVVHISPTYFKDFIGGERYPWELVKALSKYINVTLIMFGCLEGYNELLNKDCKNDALSKFLKPMVLYFNNRRLL